MTRSARLAPQRIRAARGSPAPEKRSSSRRNSARSACRPGAMRPRSGRPRQAAEPLVAQRSASSWEMRSAPWCRRWSRKARRTSSMRFEESLLAEPSTPRPTGGAGALERGHLAAARGEDHVGGRAVADRDAGAAEAEDLGLVEPDAVGEPDAAVEPALALEVVDRPAAEAGLAPGVLVLGLGEVGVEADVVAGGERRRVAHQALGDRERRAGGERDLHHGAVAGLVIAGDQALAVGEDCLLGLDDRARRQAAVLAREAHRAAGQDDAQAKAAGFLDLEVDRVLEARPGRRSGGRSWWSCPRAGARPARRARRDGGARGAASPRSGRAPRARGTAACRSPAGRRGSASGRSGGGC